MQIQIEGKNCIVTGANSGIGYATAEGLASRYDSSLVSVCCIVFCDRFYAINSCNNVSYIKCIFSGANVYLVCRNKERGEAALSEIQSKTGNSNVHLEVFGYDLALYSFFYRNLMD